MRLLFRKTLGRLEPVDDAGEAMLRGLKAGAVVAVEVKRPRNIGRLRKYWALISIVWDNVDHERYPSIEDLHAAVKVSVGLRTRVMMPEDVVAFIPGSIAYQKMTEDEFSAFFDRVCDAVAKWFLPGVNREELVAEVERMIGIAPNSDRPRPLARSDGSVTVVPDALNWIDALRREIDSTPGQRAAQHILDANLDVLQRIEAEGRERRDESVVEAATALARYGLSKAGIGGTDA